MPRKAPSPTAAVGSLSLSPDCCALVVPFASQNARACNVLARERARVRTLSLLRKLTHSAHTRMLTLSLAHARPHTCAALPTLLRVIPFQLERHANRRCVYDVLVFHASKRELSPDTSHNMPSAAVCSPQNAASDTSDLCVFAVDWQQFAVHGRHGRHGWDGRHGRRRNGRRNGQLRRHGQLGRRHGQPGRCVQRGERASGACARVS